jgi:hypothetical protein
MCALVMPYSPYTRSANADAAVFLGLRIRHVLKPEEEKDLTPLLAVLDSESTTLEEANEGLKLLYSFGVDENEYKAKAGAKFPLAKVFKGAK